MNVKLRKYIIVVLLVGSLLPACGKRKSDSVEVLILTGAIASLSFEEHPTEELKPEQDPPEPSCHYESEFSESPVFGGGGGTAFSDKSALLLLSELQPQRIHVRATARLDKIGISLNNSVTLMHGGDGGTYSYFDLLENEDLVKVETWLGIERGSTRVFGISLTTNLSRTFFRGATTGTYHSMEAPESWKIVGFHGRSA